MIHIEIADFRICYAAEQSQSPVIRLVDGEIAITSSTFGRFACKECSCRLEGNKVLVLHVKRELPFLRIPRVLFLKAYVEAKRTLYLRPK